MAAARPFYDYYEILGVDPDATPDEITHAYRELARLYHPDALHGKSDNIRRRAEVMFKRANAAYECLRDGKTRREYDASWREVFRPEQASGRARAKARKTPSEWRCTDCTQHNSTARAFCSECGYPRDEAVAELRRAERVKDLGRERLKLQEQGLAICPACGRFKNLASARFCGGCGEDIDDFWNEGPEGDPSGRLIFGAYGITPDEVFDAVIRSFAEKDVIDLSDLEMTLTARISKGLFTSKQVTISVVPDEETGCHLYVGGLWTSKAEAETYDQILLLVHDTLRGNILG